MSGTLFVVATPIGNLEDITLRALRVLREVHVIAAEDTRRTARLLSHHGILTPTISFHEHNTKIRLPTLLARLTAGESVALVTDAGTPSISDPGLVLVEACIENNVALDPIPGACAPLTAAMVSGFPLEPWTLLGFPPTKPGLRAVWFADLARIEHTVSFLESPHRIVRTLQDVGDYLGNRQMVVGRELTKLHQEFIRGSAQFIGEKLTPRGEFTVVVGPRKPPEKEVICLSDAEIADEVRRSTEQGSPRKAISKVARRLGRTTRDVYAAVQRAKSLVE